MKPAPPVSSLCESHRACQSASHSSTQYLVCSQWESTWVKQLNQDVFWCTHHACYFNVSQAFIILITYSQHLSHLGSNWIMQKIDYLLSYSRGKVVGREGVKGGVELIKGVLRKLKLINHMQSASQGDGLITHLMVQSSWQPSGAGVIVSILWMG